MAEMWRPARDAAAWSVPVTGAARYTTRRGPLHNELLLPPNRLRPSFFAIFFKRLDKNQRNFRSEHLRSCPNFHYLDILLSHKYFRHFPLTRNVNFQEADSLSE